MSGRTQPKSLVLFSIMFLFVSLIALFARDSKGEPSHATPTQPPTGALPNAGVTLDLIVDGTWGIVKHYDGTIDILTPPVPGHTSPFVRALNEKDLKAGDYLLTFNSTPINKNVCSKRPPSTSSGTPPIFVDPQHHRLVCISLPKPDSIVYLHRDKTVVQPDDPEVPSLDDTTYDDTKEQNYITTLSIRFKLTDFSNIQLQELSGTSPKTYPISVANLDDQGLLFVSVGPEDPDDANHGHARNAFRQLVALFPTLSVFVDYPRATKNSQMSMVTPDNRQHSGLDCRAPMVLVDCTSGESSCTAGPVY